MFNDQISIVLTFDEAESFCRDKKMEMSYINSAEIETVSHYMEFSDTKQWWNGRHQINGTHARQNGTLIEQDLKQMAILIEQQVDEKNATELRWVTIPSEERTTVSCVCFQSRVHFQEWFFAKKVQSFKKVKKTKKKILWSINRTNLIINLCVLCVIILSTTFMICWKCHQ